MRESISPECPKKCPCGHKHLSWSPGDKDVFCWDCNRKYPLSDCFGPRIVQPGKAPEAKA